MRKAKDIHVLVEIKMHDLPASMHACVGSTGADYVRTRPRHDLDRIFNCCLHGRHARLAFPAVVRRAVVFNGQSVSWHGIRSRISMALPERIYLTGFMASGKSTVGFITANTIGYDFADIDELVVESEGRTIQQVFDEDGEAYFRKLESDVLRATADRRRTVIALGGGTLVTDEAYALLPDDSVVVYIDTDPSVLARRLYYGRGVRPLMLDESGRRVDLEEAESRVRRLMADRVEYYRRADVTVRSGDRSIGKTVDAVVAALRRHARKRAK